MNKLKLNFVFKDCIVDTRIDGSVKVFWSIAYRTHHDSECGAYQANTSTSQCVRGPVSIKNMQSKFCGNA